MKISVVIPVYGVEPYIEACLKSVASQLFDGEIECLIVDDCGPDRSMEVAERFISEYHGPVDFRIIRRKANGGLSEARNSGLDAASGQYIYFLDSDDELLAGAMQALADAMTRQPADIIIGDYIVSGAPHVYPRLYMPDGTHLNGQEALESYCRNEWYMMAVNKLYSLEFLRREKLRFMPGILHEDELWSFQCAMRAKSIGSITVATYNYKVRPGSIMTAQNKRRRVDCYAVILREILREVNSGNKEYTAPVHRFVRHKLFVLLGAAAGVLPSSELRATYDNYRRSLPIGLPRILRLSGLNPRQWARDIHLLLPPALGLQYLKYSRR